MKKGSELGLTSSLTASAPKVSSNSKNHSRLIKGSDLKIPLLPSKPTDLTITKNVSSGNQNSESMVFESTEGNKKDTFD